jgi:hypothetical protein
MHPARDDLWRELGVALLAAEEPELARQAFQNSLARNPDQPELREEVRLMGEGSP